MTPEEIAVLQTLGAAWNQFSSMKPAHPCDAEDFMRAIHAAQNIVLARRGMRDEDVKLMAPGKAE